MAKTRMDAWGEDIQEAKGWELYEELRSSPWADVRRRLSLEGIVEPSRAGWYRWLARMRRADAARRIERIAASVAEAQGVADKAGIKAAVFVETLKTLAIDRAMSGDDKGATGFASAAAAIWDRAQRERELELRAAAQQTKDEALKLAREKFEAAERRENAAKGAIADAKLTDEQRMAKLREIYGI